ncbi:MAG: glycosyltransferase family 4 protein [Planctomycetota bacterium]
MRTKTLLYQGLLRSPASWARVGRGYVAACVRLAAEFDLDVRATHVRGFGYDAEFPTPAGLNLIEPHDIGDAPDIGLGFLHPPLLQRLHGATRANLFVWEGTRFPAQWAKQLSQGVDFVIVPSQFVAAAAIHSGVPQSQLLVVPYGHDQPAAPGSVAAADSEAFTLATIGAPHWRKGHAELLRAYRQAFTAADPVVLRIKTTYDPAARRRTQHFELPGWERLLRDEGLRDPAAPRVDITAAVVEDAAINSFLDAADLYVAPSWGEAFGLAILDAAARGLPVVTTAWSGPVEFLPESPDLVPFELAADPRGSYQPWSATEPNEIARPDVAAIATRMRWHFENREASRAIGADLQLHVRDRTWHQAARELLMALCR